MSVLEGVRDALYCARDELESHGVKDARIRIDLPSETFDRLLAESAYAANAAESERLARRGPPNRIKINGETVRRIRR